MKIICMLDKANILGQAITNGLMFHSDHSGISQKYSIKITNYELIIGCL